MRKLNLFLMTICFAAIVQAQNNVAINNDASLPDASAILDIKSVDKGILIPRMTHAQMLAIGSPQKGLMVYQTDGNSGFYYNAGTSGTPSWKKVGEASYPTANANKVAYFSAGVHSFIVPSGVDKIFFEIVGGGGGSGGSYLPASGFAWGGGGGGGGAFARGYISVTPAETLTLTIGDRGANGTNSSATATAGTAGSASNIASGAAILINANGGNGGAAGNSSGPGAGGLGAFAGPMDVSRCILSSYVPQVFPGGTGLGINAPSAIVLTGVSGSASNYGEFNIITRVSEAAGGGGSTLMSYPFYGIGAGYGTSAQFGYIVIYW